MGTGVGEWFATMAMEDAAMGAAVTGATAAETASVAAASLAGPTAAAGAGMTIGQSMALSAGSQVLGSLLAPEPTKQIPGTGILKSDPTAMPEAPGPIQRARKEQELMRKRTMGRDYTASLSDNLG